MTESTSILVIDDSEDDREFYRRTLKKSEDAVYDIVEAGSGEQGLARLAEALPACVLLDYSLPGRNGVEVLKRLRAEHPFVPVVMLTGQGNETVAVTAMQEGAQNYISKATITPEALQRVIRTAIEHCAMERRIQEQRESLEIFTRALAHDLKEPIRTIKSFLSLVMAHEKLSEKGQGYFNYIQNASDRMAALIDAVYFYTRLDGSPQEIGKEVCDAAAVLEEAKADISALIKERNAVISAGPLPIVTANRRQLAQVLQNLMCNAIQHCQVNPVIEIEASEGATHWIFRATDNGPGIDVAQREKIFQPFKRLAQSKAQGLGLGLAICKKIVETHGGKIWCEAPAQKGASFVFTIPKDATEVAVVAAPLEESRIVPEAIEAKPMANLLLVDDNEADIELTRIMLFEEAGLQCNLLVAHDAYEAMNMLRAPENKDAVVDLLLLDINMPGMDGFELLENMRGLDALRATPVVMCTTSAYDKDMERAKLLGALGYLTKPAEMNRLKPLLDRIGSLDLRRETNGYTLLRAA